jgi:hypothetical protein
MEEGTHGKGCNGEITKEAGPIVFWNDIQLERNFLLLDGLSFGNEHMGVSRLDSWYHYSSFDSVFRLFHHCWPHSCWLLTHPPPDVERWRRAEQLIFIILPRFYVWSLSISFITLFTYAGLFGLLER